MNNDASVCITSTYFASDLSSLTMLSTLLKYGSAGSNPVILPNVNPKSCSIIHF